MRTQPVLLSRIQDNTGGTGHACIPPRQQHPIPSHPTWTKKRCGAAGQARPIHPLLCVSSFSKAATTTAASHPPPSVRVAWPASGPHRQALPDRVGPARLATWTAWSPNGNKEFGGGRVGGGRDLGNGHIDHRRGAPTVTSRTTSHAAPSRPVRIRRRGRRLVIRA